MKLKQKIEGKIVYNIKNYENLKSHNYKSYSLRRLLFSIKKSNSYPLHTHRNYIISYQIVVLCYVIKV